MFVCFTIVVVVVVVAIVPAPEVISLIQFQQDFENRIISLDWSGTFRYNGILRYFDVRRNGILLVRNSGTATSLPQEPVGISKLESLYIIHVAIVIMLHYAFRVPLEGREGGRIFIIKVVCQGLPTL